MRKGEFQLYVDSRQARLAEKATQNFVAQLAKEREAKQEAGEAAEAAEETGKTEDAAMDGEDPKEKKISTSGWRKSRHTAYKQRKSTKAKKFMKFGSLKY